MKKIISALIIISLLTTQLVFLSGAVSENLNDITGEVIEFVCGADSIAYLNKNTKTLTVKGTGEMSFFYSSRPPWFEYADYISYVIIEEGITAIANVSFINSFIEKILIPASVERIGYGALCTGDVKNIIIAENSKLCEHPYDSYFEQTTWFNDQPDGPVYMGKLLLGYKGTMPENTTIKVEEGTYAINEEAFLNQTNLIDIEVPESVERIGYNAFKGTSWESAKPLNQPIYINDILYKFNRAWKLYESDKRDVFTVEEGTKSISSGAFTQASLFKTIVLPESLEHIGSWAFDSMLETEKIIIPQNGKLEHIASAAFYGCYDLAEISLPQNLKQIDGNAFCSCPSLKSLTIPASVEVLGITPFEPNSFDFFEIEEGNGNYCSDENGIVYNKDKTVVYTSPKKLELDELILPETVKEIGIQAFAVSGIKNIVLPKGVSKIGFEAFTESAIESINIPYGVKSIEERAFYMCSSLKYIETPKSVKSINTKAFYLCNNLKEIVIPEEVIYINDDALDLATGAVLYCYKDSTAYNYAIANNMIYSLLMHPDTEKLDTLLEEYENLDRSKTDEISLAALDEAVSKVDMTITVITQEMVDSWVADIEKAKEQIIYKPADYSAVNSAIQKADEVNRSLYTSESLAALDEAVASVDFSLNVLEQNLIDEYANNIYFAILNLQYLPADYTAVENAKATAATYSLRLYSEVTVAALEQSIAAVDYTLNITEQDKVDLYAENIVAAINFLEYAEVILRNEPNGIIVSATAKELDPDTALTVDLKDPSDLQTGNFAVGGTVKSLTLYDINLLLNAQKTQPDGFVNVKIKIPDGVDPKRCKVYHVTNDPVDPLIRYTTTLEGNFITFETDHFSEFAVIEVETVINSIEITKLPNKTQYALGETVVTSGMEVMMHLSDGSSVEVSDYDVSTVDTSSIGTKAVTVYYTYNGVTKSASFEITVTGDKITASITSDSEDITEYNKKVSLFRGYNRESLQLGYSLSAPGNYKAEWLSDNEKVLVDSNGKVTNKGFFFARKATITLKITDSAGNVIATDTMAVRFYKLSFQLPNLQTVTNSFYKKFFLIF